MKIKNEAKKMVLAAAIALIIIATWCIFFIILKNNRQKIQSASNLAQDDIVEVEYKKDLEDAGADEQKIFIDENNSIQDQFFAITKDLKIVKQEVPFTSQAPQAQWEIEMFQDACEEASIIMAMKWARDDMNLSTIEARDEIINISNFEQEKYGFHLDVSLRDVEKVFYDYYNYKNIELKEISKKEDLIKPLYDGDIVIIPTNGKALKNPNFSDGGPDRHMLVILGYDPQKSQFITNDPGTKRGKDYRYEENLLFNAVRNYASGYHQMIIGNEKLMLVIKKS